LGSVLIRNGIEPTYLTNYAGYLGSFTGIMFRLFLRVLGLCLLATAFVTLIVDGTHTIAAGTLYITSVGDCLVALLPGKFIVARDFIEAHAPHVVWDPILVKFLKLPVWLVSGVIGALAIRLGGKPAPKFGYSSR
jgi:hypothetical protein